MRDAKDYTGQTLFDVDLRGQRLHGAKITLDCQSFDGVILSNEQVALLLLLVSMAAIDDGWIRGLHTLVGEMVGEHELEVLKRYLALT